MSVAERPRRAPTERRQRGAMCAVLLAVLLSVFPAEAATAQIVLPPPGTRVRATTDSGKIVGHLSGARRDTILVRPEHAAEDREISLQDIRRLEMSRGIQPRTGRGALIGLVSGAVAGAVSGMIVCAGDNCVNSGEDLTNLVPVALGIGGGVVGAGTGALIGAQFHGEQWRTIPLPGAKFGMAHPPPEPGIRLAFTLGIESRR